MEEFKDYKVLIEDLEVPKQDLTKAELTGIINKKLSKNWSITNNQDGIDIEIEPEWKNILINDGSFLWEYTKLGWKAMQYQQNRNDGTVREWLNFKNLNYKVKKKGLLNM